MRVECGDSRRNSLRRGRSAATQLQVFRCNRVVYASGVQARTATFSDSRRGPEIKSEGFIKKRWDTGHQGPSANDADSSLFLVPDARLSAALQMAVLQRRSHPSWFRDIRAGLARSSPYRSG